MCIRDSFLYYLRYIHHNPIHHHVALNYTDWEHSSYKCYTENKEIVGMSIEPVLRYFLEESDTNGIQGFINSHQDFKRDFRKK